MRRIGGRVSRGLLGCVLLGSASLLAPARADQANSHAPFVAGFERFARHGEIEPIAAGRLLIGELSCVACHASADPDLQPKGGPRLEHAGLRLRPEWVERFLAHPSAVKPGTTMPDALAALDALQRPAVAAALTAYLASRQEPFAEVPASGVLAVPYQFWDRGDAAAGRERYHRIGCVACHRADVRLVPEVAADSAVDQLLDQLDPEELQELGLAGAARRVDSVPLGDLAQKYTRRGLTEFLLDPVQFRPSGRMPSLKLLPTDAADLAAYLLSDDFPVAGRRPMPDQSGSQSRDSHPDPRLVTQGREWFVKLRCSQCHAGEGLEGFGYSPPGRVEPQARRGGGASRPSLLVPRDPPVKDRRVTRGATNHKPDDLNDGSKPVLHKLDELNLSDGAGCLSELSGAGPRYGLDSAQSRAIRAALVACRDGVAATTEDALQQTLLRFNCYACHERDGRGGVGRYRKAYFENIGGIDLGDEGRLPPPLTGVGQKLQPAWFKRVLLGQDADIRPHMTIRMPRFNQTIAASLPQQLAEVDAVHRPVTSASFAPATADLAEAGRQLVDSGCVQCHPFRGFALPGVVGVDLRGVPSRIRPGWFHDFILDPGSLKSRTRMPTFFPDGATQQPELLGGDANLQIAALWSYLEQIDDHPLPEKIRQARSQDYQLQPRERPILLRTFMVEAGTHAIAVGFPQGTHIAFDAEQMRLASAWRGAFLDAQGTWFIRFAPPAVPLGEDLITVQLGPPFAPRDGGDPAWRTDLSEYRFGGYRLDPQGQPTFLYRYQGVDIEDRIVPDADGGLRRTLRLRPRDEAAAATANPLWFAGNHGHAIESTTSKSSANDEGLSVRILSELTGSPVVIQDGDMKRWAVPIAVGGETMLEIHYQW